MKLFRYCDFVCFLIVLNVLQELISSSSTGCHQITCIHLTQQGTVEPEPLHSRQLYLQYLDMTDCYALEDQGLKVIVKNCPQLLHLYLRRCINITGK